MADWLAIEGEYRAGIRTTVNIAAEHGISEVKYTSKLQRSL